MKESAFNQLRTNEQLGYIVWTGPRLSAGTLGFEVIVQGPQNPDYVMSRIQNFLDNERVRYTVITVNHFSEHFGGNV